MPSNGVIPQRTESDFLKWVPVSVDEVTGTVVPLTDQRKILVTLSPSASLEVPAEQVSVSVSEADRGVNVALDNTGAVLPIVILGDVMATPGSVPSVGVTVQ